MRQWPTLWPISSILKFVFIYIYLHLFYQTWSLRSDGVWMACLISLLAVALGTYLIGEPLQTFAKTMDK
jgi:hypothetical protein